MSDPETLDADFATTALNPLAQKLFKARTVIISGEIAKRGLTPLLDAAGASGPTAPG